MPVGCVISVLDAVHSGSGVYELANGDLDANVVTDPPSAALGQQLPCWQPSL